MHKSKSPPDLDKYLEGEKSQVHDLSAIVRDSRRYEYI